MSQGTCQKGGARRKNQIMDYITAFLNAIQLVKSKTFGKGKKKGGPGKGKSVGNSKNAKYYLKAHVSCGQGKSVGVDLIWGRSTRPAPSLWWRLRSTC